MSTSSAPVAENELAERWGTLLFAGHCPNCGATFLVPAQAGAPPCPNCLAARLEPQPALDRDTPPELVLPFTVSQPVLHANLERWRRDIPFRAASLNPRQLYAHLIRVFIPLYLADARVWGAWQAQMGFDYLVASSEERFDGKAWVTHRVNETRVRWEARAGDLTRKYENVPAPALEHHHLLMRALGGQDGGEPPYDLSRAEPYAASLMANSYVHAPDIAPNAAWISARLEIERRAAADCQTAAGAQHHSQFVLRAAYGEPEWTLLLLPAYVTYYEGDDSKLLPVRINGQTGFVSGVKRASIRRAQGWTIGIGLGTLALFLTTLFVGIAALQNAALNGLALLLLVLTLGALLVVPIPLIIAWQYNRRRAEG